MSSATFAPDPSQPGEPDAPHTPAVGVVGATVAGAGAAGAAVAGAAADGAAAAGAGDLGQSAGVRVHPSWAGPPSQPGVGAELSQPGVGSELPQSGVGVGLSQPGVGVEFSQPGGAGYPPYQEPKQDRVTRFIQRRWRNSPVWAAPAAMLVCMAGAVGYTLATHPTEAGAGAAPSCLLKYTTGFICPGCGGTRAAWYLLHGDIPAAARHHALFVFAVPFLLYMYVAWAGKRLFNWKLPELVLSPGVIGAFIAAWGVFSVIRNLPWAPFTAFYV